MQEAHDSQRGQLACLGGSLDGSDSLDCLNTLETCTSIVSSGREPSAKQASKSLKTCKRQFSQDSYRLFPFSLRLRDSPSCGHDDRAILRLLRTVSVARRRIAAVLDDEVCRLLRLAVEPAVKNVNCSICVSCLGVCRSEARVSPGRSARIRTGAVAGGVQTNAPRVVPDCASA
jgi:hypothetical protein